MRHVHISPDNEDVMLENLQKAFFNTLVAIMIDCRHIHENKRVLNAFVKRVKSQIPTGTFWKYDGVQNGILVLVNLRQPSLAQSYSNWSPIDKAVLAINMTLELGTRAVCLYNECCERRTI